MEMGDPSRKNEVNADKFDLVPRMRIDFTVLPVDGRLHYNCISIESCITSTLQQLVGDHDLTFTDSIVSSDLHLPRPSVNNLISYGDEHTSMYRYRVENQLKYGNPGYFFVRDLTFVDRFPGDNWDQKFYNARQFIIQEMHCMNVEEGQLLLTHLKPSEDALRLINLIPHDDSTPTVILKGVPIYWLQEESSVLSLRRLFQSLGKVRDIHMCRQDTPHVFSLVGNISIQYEDKEEFSKAIKRLCSHSLKLKKNGHLVDYELSLKDFNLTFNASQEVLTYIDNGYNDRPRISQALNYPMAMLEKELKTVKALMEEKIGALYNYNLNNQEPPVRGFKHRVAMLEKEINTLKALTEKSGSAGDNESHTTEVHQVAILDKEVNALKALMEEYSVALSDTPATQALKRQLAMLEQRVTMLEKERNSMKTAS